MLMVRILGDRMGAESERVQDGGGYGGDWMDWIARWLGARWLE